MLNIAIGVDQPRRLPRRRRRRRRQHLHRRSAQSGEPPARRCPPLPGFLTACRRTALGCNPAARARSPCVNQEPRPRCPHYPDCVGCALIGTPYTAQLRAKQARLGAALAAYPRLAGIAVPPVIGSPRLFGYRNQAKLVARRAGRGLLLGVYRPGTHQVVDIAAVRRCIRRRSTPCWPACAPRVEQQPRADLRRAQRRGLAALRRRAQQRLEEDDAARPGGARSALGGRGRAAAAPAPRCAASAAWC